MNCLTVAWRRAPRALSVASGDALFSSMAPQKASNSITRSGNFLSSLRLSSHQKSFTPSPGISTTPSSTSLELCWRRPSAMVLPSASHSTGLVTITVLS